MAERGTDQYLADRYPGTNGDPAPLRAGEKPLDSWQAPKLIPAHSQDMNAGPSGWRQRMTQESRVVKLEPPMRQWTSEIRSAPMPERQAQPAPEQQTAESASYDRERGRGALPPIARGGRQ